MNFKKQLKRLDLTFFYRKKQVNYDDSRLARVLNTLDLTALGVGSTLGAGIYVLAGSVIKDVTGPSIIISFAIAALASVLAGLCYAEFGAQVPKSGSAYVYTYVTVGELMAFIIGWNLILEYLIGTASVARAFSTYFDSLINNSIQNFFRKNMSLHITGLSEYPDFFAFAITALITMVLCIGVKESSRMNNIFTCVNLTVVVFIIIAGAVKVNFENWKLTPGQLTDHNLTMNMTAYFNMTSHENNKEAIGQGGFFPFGFSGMFAGAAKCFYAFVGFDCIATTGEETKNPQKAIPLGIILSLAICTIAYCSVSGVLSLMVPYYLVDSNAPLPEAFRYVGMNWARWIVAIGAICSLSTSLLGSMFPLPRVLYAIATDGLIFKFLARVNSRLQTPFLATIISGTFAGVLAAIFDLDQLVNMMSIGTLLAYSLVAISILILRYKTDESSVSNQTLKTTSNNLLKEKNNLFKILFKPDLDEPSEETSYLSNIIIFLSVIDLIIICSILTYVNISSMNGIVLLVIFGAIFLFFMAVLVCQPQSKKSITFRIPLVPLFPFISIFINFYLMLVLSVQTWIRFAVWMLIGFLIYFGYGVRHSLESKKNRLKTSESNKILNNGVTNESFDLVETNEEIKI